MGCAMGVVCLCGVVPFLSAKLFDPSLLTLRRRDGVQSVSGKRQGLDSISFTVTASESVTVPVTASESVTVPVTTSESVTVPVTASESVTVPVTTSESVTAPVTAPVTARSFTRSCEFIFEALMLFLAQYTCT